jgi:hypothetical protein
LTIPTLFVCEAAVAFSVYALAAPACPNAVMPASSANGKSLLVICFSPHLQD